MKTKGKTMAYFDLSPFIKFTRMMKLVCAMMLLCCLHVSAGGHTQNRVTLNLQSADLKKVMMKFKRKRITVFCSTSR